MEEIIPSSTRESSHGSGNRKGIWKRNKKGISPNSNSGNSKLQCTQAKVTNIWKNKERKQKERLYTIWGDNPDNKDSSSLRITSTNINGLSTISELTQYIVGSYQFSSDINCFQEINIDTTKSAV